MPHQAPYHTPELAPALALPGDAFRDGQPHLERMEQGERLAIDSSSSIYPAEEIGLPSTDYDGSRISVVAEVGLSANPKAEILRAAIVKRTYPDGTVAFRVRGLGEPYATYDGQVRRTVLGVTEDTPGLPVAHIEQSIGRALKGSQMRCTADDIWGMQRVDAAHQMSRRHLKIQEEDGKVIVTDTSANGTFLLARRTSLPTHRAEYTKRALDEADRRGLIVNGKYQGFSKQYDVVTRSTPVRDGMVDLRAQPGGGEAQIIDSTDPNFKNEYDKLRGMFNQRFQAMRAKDGSYGEADVLRMVYETMLAATEYDLSYVNGLSDRLRAQAGFAHEVNIGQYIRDGKAVCRQMALASAWLVNDLHKHGFLRGEAVTGANENIQEHSGHEWARYTAQNGTVYIIDRAQEFFGTLEDSLRLERKGEAVWEYFLPGEKEAYLAKLELQDKAKASRLRNLGRKALRVLISR